jgi:hypothetical protein
MLVDRGSSHVAVPRNDLGWTRLMKFVIGARATPPPNFGLTDTPLFYTFFTYFYGQLKT